MKTYLQFIRRFVPLIVCFALFFSLPAFAAVPTETIDPFDYLISVSTSGDKSEVTFSLDSNDITPYHRLHVALNDGTQYVDELVSPSYTAAFSLISKAGKRFNYWCFPLGSYYQRGTSTPEGAIDVSGLLNGSSIDLSIDYDLQLLVVPAPSGPGSASYSHTLDVQQYLHLYDADGNYVNTITSIGSTRTFRIKDGTVHWDLVLSDSLTISPDIRYIIPYLEVTGSDTYTLTCWKFINQAPSISWSCSIDAVEDDSLLMQAINSQLGDIGDSLDDISSGIDSANDKLDGIQSGINGTNDRLDDVNQGIGDINDTLNKDSGIDSGVADFGSAGDSLSEGMSGAVDSIEEGLGVVSGLTSSGSMTSTLTTISTAMAHAFSGRHQIYLCGLRFNPFNGWVLVFGGLALIGLVISYIFRKRGGK